MKGDYLRYVLYLFFAVFILGCNNSADTEEDESAPSDDLILVTKQQFESDNMKIGELSLQPFAEMISCNGYVTAPPNGIAKISTQITGIVENIYCTVGDYVKKGAVLCRVSSTELIELQQDFAETSATLKRLKADWERSKALYEENIGAEKNYKAIESEYHITQAKYQSFKLRLELVDLNTSKIEAGELYSTYPILAPLSGYITNLHIVLGQFIEPQRNLLEIVDVNQLQLHLSVFENDIINMNPGQEVKFKSLGESGFVHTAILTSIGRSINPEAKTISCLAEIKKEPDFNFINQTYIEAKIFIDEVEAEALPTEAILKSEQNYFVLILEKSDDQYYYLGKVPVEIGRVSNGYTEIIDSEGITKVITQGVYNLNLE